MKKKALIRLPYFISFYHISVLFTKQWYSRCSHVTLVLLFPRWWHCSHQYWHVHQTPWCCNYFYQWREAGTEHKNKWYVQSDTVAISNSDPALHQSLITLFTFYVASPYKGFSSLFTSKKLPTTHRGQTFDAFSVSLCTESPCPKKIVG